MQLTSFTDYGLRALVYMAALPAGQMTTITEVTEIYGVSRNHMVKIINQLGHAGLVTAIRGKNGGIKLAMPANTIRLGDVVRKMEPLTLVNCSPEACVMTKACRMKAAFGRAIQLFLGELDNHTLADMVDDNTLLRQLLKIEVISFAE